MRIVSQREKWLAAYWRWFLKALDERRYETALKLAKIIQKLERN